jgi:MFS family permease
MPIWVVFLNTTRELSLGEVYLIAGVGWIVQAVSEVPTGAFADTYGRKVTLMVGSVMLALGLFLLAALTGFGGLLIAFILLAAVCVLPLALAFPLRSLAAAEPAVPIIGATGTTASGEW